jgi:nucleotide-binding universal stress UspA family protein
MSTSTTPTASQETARPRGAPRIAVLYERTANGTAALREASDLAGAAGSVTVVAFAPQSLPSGCCGASVDALNRAVRDAAADDLAEARILLGADVGGATFKCVLRYADPPLPVWLADQGFDVIVLPARRLSRRGHPLARRLERVTDAEIRIAR